MTDTATEIVDLAVAIVRRRFQVSRSEAELLFADLVRPIEQMIDAEVDDAVDYAVWQERQDREEEEEEKKNAADAPKAEASP